MKKLIALLLSFALLFTLCACGVEDEDVRGDITGTNDVVSEPKQEEKEFSLGTTDGLVYENDFIGLGCQLDDGWSFYDDEQIKELNNMASDMAGEEYQELIQDADIVYDMYATDYDNVNNININLEKINAIQLAALDLDDNFESLAPTLKTSLENMGVTNYEYEVAPITIDGKEVSAMRGTAEVNGVKMYQTSISKKCNGYLANITITTFFEDANAELLDNFYWID